jgi:hypothetical protein
MPGLADYGALMDLSHHLEESRRGARFKSQGGWKLHQQGPTATTEAIVSAINRSNGSRDRRSWWSCVISRGTLTANRNSSGVATAHLTYVTGECDRENDELISAHGNTRA